VATGICPSELSQVFLEIRQDGTPEGTFSGWNSSGISLDIHLTSGMMCEVQRKELNMAILPNVTPEQQAEFENKCFQAWMKKADLACQSKCGMSIYDLADVCFRDMYDDGQTPAYAARKAIRNSME